MRHLLNTLYVLTEDTYLSLDNNNVVINQDNSVLRKFPLNMLEQILYFGYKGVSPALMGECARRGISLCFYKPNGRFLARIVGTQSGNVLLRKKKVASTESEDADILADEDIVTEEDLEAEGDIDSDESESLNDEKD